MYVDRDAVVLAHAHELLEGSSEGSTIFLEEDVRSPERILDRASAILDLSLPVAVMLVGLLHHLRDDDKPAELVARLLEGVAPGSYLVITHLARDIQAPGYAEAGEHLDEAMEEPMIFRTRSQVAELFAGRDLVPLGVVQVDQWHPETPAEVPEGWTNPLYAGVGRT